MQIFNRCEGLSVERNHHFLCLRLEHKNRVLSTCPVNGGMKENLRCLINHQICEPKNDYASENGQLAVKDMDAYHQKVAREHGFASDEVALFSTAASMNNAGISHEKAGDLEVVAVVTAGVETNAGCAGDPAGYVETPEGFVSLDLENNLGPGTIVTMVFINQELQQGAMLVASTVATEAKSAVLRDLNVGSNFSQKLATGTGTDQVGIVCQTGDTYVYRDAGKHSRLGELIGKTVSSALLQALLLQNGMSPVSQRKLPVALKRFAITQAMLVEGVARELDGIIQERWNNNWSIPMEDVFVSAAMSGLLHVWELGQNGIIPKNHLLETGLAHAALVCCAVSSRYELYDTFRGELAKKLANRECALSDLIFNAISIGYSAKW